MSHTITFGNVNKRRNSTLQPSVSASYDVLLKTPTSLNEPTFTLSASGFNYNYFKWDNRYYYVTSIIYRNNGLVEVSGRIDPLATFKDNILATTAYVVYDTSANSEIPDKRLTTKTVATTSMNTGSEIFPTSKTGCYVLTVNGITGTASYLMNRATLAALLTDLKDTIDDALNGVNPPSSDSLIDFFTSGKEMLKSWWGNISGGGSVAECIKACIWLPYSFSGSGGTEITLGTFHTGHYGTLVSPILDLPMLTIGIPWQFSDWRNGSPYTQVGLYIPFIGTMYYDASNLKGQVSLTIERSLNLITGSMSVEVKTGDLKTVLGTYGADVGCTYPVGVSNVNWTSGITSVVGLAASVGSMVASGGLTAGGAVGATASLAGIANAITPNQSTVGGIGGGSGVGLDTNIKCFTVCHDTSDAPSNLSACWGTPCGKIKTLSACTGFVQCADAHVSLSTTYDLMQEVDNLVNSGIYIE